MFHLLSKISATAGNTRFWLPAVILLCFVQTGFAQIPDSVEVIRKKPELLLKNLKIQNFTQGGFNFWKDNFKGNWAGIEFGLNTFHATDLTGYSSDFLQSDLRRSNSLHINLVQQSIGLQKTRNTIGLVTGLGMQLKSYRLQNNMTIEKYPSGKIVEKTLLFDENQKSKFSSTYLTMPLLAEFQIPVNHYQNRIYISAGGFAAYRLSSHTKIKYRVDKKKEKLKTPGDYSLNDWRYGLSFRVGYRRLKLFCNYDLQPMFIKAKGPELYPVTFGFTVISF